MSEDGIKLEFNCSCGRKFPKESMLKRHCSLLNHTEASLSESGPTGEPVDELVVDHSRTYEAALLVIAQKRAELERSDRLRAAQALVQARREAQRQHRNFFVTQLVTLLHMTAQNLFKKTVRAASLSLVAGVALLLVLTLTTIGAHIGAAVAHSSTASIVACR